LAGCEAAAGEEVVVVVVVREAPPCSALFMASVAAIAAVLPSFNFAEELSAGAASEAGSEPAADAGALPHPDREKRTATININDITLDIYYPLKTFFHLVVGI
jgi:hypothetical protein